MKHETPSFKTEAQERAFWEDPENNSADYLDWSRAQRVVMPNLKPSTTSISLRISDGLLSMIKSAANKMDVPYQSLMKVWLTEKVMETR